MATSDSLLLRLFRRDSKKTDFFELIMDLVDLDNSLRLPLEPELDEVVPSPIENKISGQSIRSMVWVGQKISFLRLDSDIWLK